MSEEDEETKGNAASRKEKRKLLKKKKRKEKRKETAEKERQEEEIKLNDPEEQRKLELLEQEEKERVERERKEFEERERRWMENMMKKKQEEDERKLLEASIVEKAADEDNHSDDWEYVEEGPAEIIWKGNEIIVKKKQVKVPKKQVVARVQKEDAERLTSNPLPPQSEVFADYKGVSMGSAEHVYEDVAQQVPNFGTEQDKAHCPFHIKTGACRFGLRCSRVHFYPDKSFTLLIKNMYSGPGLAWEQDDGLEYIDEEVEKCYEEFYEDVHTEFLKFGEIVNFKVCRNGSFHLRGNVYVHYKHLDSAMFAYQSMNGRYFAGKQVKCEFVGVTKWKIAICGEYMKSRLKTCSRGTACNFIHCFRNPGGDYEWADWDKPPPKYWVEKMAYLFGHADGYGSEKYVDQESPEHKMNLRRKATPDSERYYSRQSRSRDRDSHRSLHKENGRGKTTWWQRHRNDDIEGIEVLEREDKREIEGNYHQESRSRHQADPDGDYSDREKYRKREGHRNPKRKSFRHQSEVFNYQDDNDEADSEGDLSCGGKDHDRNRRHCDKRKSSRHQSEGHANYYSDKEKKTHDANSDGESLEKGRYLTNKNSIHKRKASRDHDSPDDRKKTHDTNSDGESLENVRYLPNKNSSHKRKASKDCDSLGDRKKTDIDNHKQRRRKRRKSLPCLDNDSRVLDNDSADWKRKTHHPDSGDGLSDDDAIRYYRGSIKYSEQESEVSGICSDRWNPE